ncbi:MULTISPECIES: hypothetical protein [Enterobacter]|uniref:hypothetical protein n=1 Tax=Enterobacter TaxID=547 RepID=UPI0005C609E2|nr:MULTISPECIES: hypothetical protein [Enterobacter]RTQ03145.1 hypothetical protein EKN38_06675 [Enterobacter sp. WCHEn045836]
MKEIHSSQYSTVAGAGLGDTCGRSGGSNCGGSSGSAGSKGGNSANRTVITRLQIAGVAVRRIISDKAVVRLVEAVDAPEADVTMLVPTVN